MVKQRMVALLKGASRRWGGSSLAESTSLLPSFLYSPSRAFSSKLFVGGLAYHTTEEMLRKAFADHGDVVDVRIITDRETGKSRGFGFVTFSSDSDAEAAKAKMSNHLLDGRFIRVDLASARQTQPPLSTPRPLGNAAASPSSSGFSFGSPGTRPPVVEDWGPLPFPGTNATRTAASQGGSDRTAVSQGVPDSMASTANQGSAYTRNVDISPPDSTSNPAFACQSSGSASEAQSSSFYSVVSSSTASAAPHQATSYSNGGLGVLSNIPSPSSAQGLSGNGSTIASASNFQSGKGQSFASHRSPVEAGTASAQTCNIKQENSVKPGLRTGFRSEFGSFGERSGGGGRPPSVLDLGSATYDFRNFPEFDSKAYKDFQRPGELEQPKKRVLFQTNKLAPKKAETWQSKLTEEAIPPPKGPLFDFGLTDIPDAPPQSDAECSPHGGFSLNVNLDELPEAEPVRLPYSIFTARTLPPLDLPWLTPEADNWSPIGKPPRRIEDSPYSPFSPDLKDDPEFWWDPYDFDPEAKLLKQAFTEEAVEAQMTEEMKREVKVHKEPEVEAKVIKEPEADDVPAVANAAAS